MGRQWNDKEIELLRKFAKEGKSTQEMAIILNRSKKAIENKIYKSNISLNDLKNKNKYKYEVGEIVNETLKIVEQIRVKNGNATHRGYIIQSVIYPNAKAYEIDEYYLKKGVGCAYITGRRVCDENSLWSIEKLRKNIINVEEAKNIVAHSNKKIKFKCETVGCNNTKMMNVDNLLRRGYSCALCSNKVSYPERMMASYLTVKNIEFKTQILFDDTQRRIDFYIPYLNIYVETHGNQHYDKNDRWYKSSVKSDKIKRKWAEDNNKKLIELDCRKSTFEFIKNSINECEYLPNILKEDEEEIINNIETSSKYDVQNIIKMYENGLSGHKISDKLNLSPSIIYGLLRRNGVKLRTKNSK